MHLVLIIISHLNNHQHIIKIYVKIILFTSTTSVSGARHFKSLRSQLLQMLADYKFFRNDSIIRKLR